MHTMQKFLILAIAAAFITLTLSIRELPTVASTVTLLNENFNNISAWKDMSTAVTWDGHPEKTSAFYTSSIGGGNIANNIWARPAYHARIRSGNNSGSFAMLQYGGDRYTDGEYEQYDAGSNGTPDWWLPGFIQQNAGGGSPGVGSPFPNSSWTRLVNGLASTNWQTFRYIIAPGVQELWRDTTETGSFTREIRMPLPSSSTAPLYKYFPTLHGLRLYWRAGGTSSQVLVDYLKVTVAQ